MSQYNQIKNTGITKPNTGTDLGSSSNKFGNLYLSGNVVLNNTTTFSTSSAVPKISSISYVGDNTAADIAGGETVTITGSGFMTGLSVYVAGVLVGSASYVNSTTATFTSPVKTAGSYTLQLVNTDGGVATYIPGVQYSGVPAWSTSAGSIANVYEYSSVSTSVVATGDAPITYSVSAGNSLPSGLTIGSGNGLVSGTTTAVASGSTTTNFYLNASDGQNQDTARNFSITVNADSVSWSSPADNTSYSVPTGTAISNVALSASSAAGKSITYTANALPTGLSISGANITGTPTAVGNTAALITATASTTGKTATRTLNWSTYGTDPYFNYTTLLLSGDITTWITDASTNNSAVTAYGDAKASTLTPFSISSYPTSGSGYFDGNGDYLRIPTSSNFTIGASNFTVEAWIYVTGGSGTQREIVVRHNQGVGLNWMLELTAGNQASFYFNGTSGGESITSDGTVSLNQWLHVAGGINGSNKFVCLNGVYKTAAYTSAPVTTGTSITLDLTIGATVNPGIYFTGYISNVRIVKGTAVYTATYTPSTAPLTAIANTSLLTLQNAQSTQNDSFTDSSTNNFSMTRNGDATQGTFSPFSQTGWSTYFLRSNTDYLGLPNGSVATGSNDFSIEAWIFLIDRNSNYAMFGGNTDRTTAGGSSITLTVTSSNGYLEFTGWFGGSPINMYSSTLPLSTWTHFVVCRTSGTLGMFINGTRVATTSCSGAINNGSAANNPSIGSNGTGSADNFTGYISNFRMIIGSGVYSATSTTCTVPTAPLTAVSNTRVLACQDNRYIDRSTNAYAITPSGSPSIQAFSPFAPSSLYSASTVGGSYYGDGSGDYLLNTTNNLQIASSTNFTLEFWVYRMTSFTGDQGACVFAIGTEAANRMQFTLYGSAIRVEVYAGTLDFNGGTVPLNAWTHVAVVRSGSTMTIYVNGTSAATATWTGVIGNTGGFVFGANRSISNYINGYISGLRLLNGTALYTTTFTPPTAPPTAITNTSLLLNFTNAGIYDATSKNDLHTIADARISTAQSKFGGSSMYFDGTGDYIQPSGNNIGYVFGTEDFTIEFWAYFNATGNMTIYEGRPGVNGAYIRIDYWSSTLRLYANTGVQITGSSVSTGQWYHIALCRASGSTKMFLNGTQTGSTYADSTSYLSGTNRPRIGNGDTPTEGFNGYIDDLRITKGIARYTANFTAPTAALPLR
jgi:hypothetical protein